MRLAILAGLVGALVLAPAPYASAEPIDPQENSLQSAADSFVAYLKTETNEAVTAAIRAARENKDTVEAGKAWIDAAIARLNEALSEEKARLKTLGRDATAMSQSWRDAATGSWAEIQRSARAALDWIETWMRNQSLFKENPEIPV